MTNTGIFGPKTPDNRLAALRNPAGSGYGSTPAWDPASNGFVLRNGSKYDPRTSSYNVGDSSLRRWQAQLAKALTSTTPAAIVCIGDSITQGVTSTPQRLYNWPARLRAVLSASGRMGVVGEGAAFNTGATASSYDERWTLGTGWSKGGGGLLNASTFAASAGATGTLSFALPSCDTIYVYYLRHSIEGTWTYTIDGGAPVSINANGATGIIKSAAISTTVGTHTIAFTAPPTTNGIAIMGIQWATSSAPNDVEVYTGGAQTGYTSISALLENAGATGFGMLTMMDLLKPDLTLVCIGRNDAAPGNSVSPAQFVQNYSAFIQRLRVTNKTDIMIVTPPPSSLGTYALNDTMMSALYAMADSYDVALVDLSQKLGTSWDVAPYNMSSDSIHPNDAGRQLMAQAVADVLLTAN